MRRNGSRTGRDNSGPRRSTRPKTEGRQGTNGPLDGSRAGQIRPQANGASLHNGVNRRSNNGAIVTRPSR